MEIELKYLVEEPIAREKILKDSHLSEIKEKGSEEEIKLDAYITIRRIWTCAEAGWLFA